MSLNIKDYNIDAGSTEIFMTVTVNKLAGIAATVVAITLGNGTTINKPGSPNDGSGNIPRTSLGQVAAIVGGLVRITTTLDLSTTASSNWQACFDNLLISYQMEGGGAADASQPFIIEDVDKTQSDSGQTIVVHKYIQLNQN